MDRIGFKGPGTDSYTYQDITYDGLGNPLTYKGNTLTWTNVRRLASYGSNTFAYGADGIRYRKNNTYYTLDGNRILKEYDGTKTILYYYGANGVIGFRYNGVDYYYRKNLFGDVLAIYDSNGTVVAEYLYDAWGRVLAAIDKTDLVIANINPFRYRSYYYDTETGLYYLESRYYDPQTGRFINADELEHLGDGESLQNYNLFEYCNDNPIMFVDPTGTSAITAILLGIVIGACVGALGTAICDYADNHAFDTDLKTYVLNATVCAIIGGFIGWGAHKILSTNPIGKLRVARYNSWQNAEEALRKWTFGKKATFQTSIGQRKVDSYSFRVIREAKYGYQGLSKFIQKEIEKDVWILNNTKVRHIEWHFYRSQISNSAGSSKPLLEELIKNGIKVVYH